MAEVKKVVIEEFDDEGNLVKRTTTEYDTQGRPTGYETWPSIQPYVGDVWPYGQGQITYAGPKVTAWNGTRFTYDYGTTARRAVGGTDRKRDGTVIE